MPGQLTASRVLAALLLGAAVVLSASGQVVQRGLELTKEEQQWLAEHSEIRLAAYANYPPAQFLDEKGRHSGLAADYQHLIEAMLGISFVEVESRNWDAVLEESRSRGVDVLALAAETPDRLEYLAFTKPYLDLPAVIIARDSVEGPLTPADLEGMRVTVPSGYAVQSYLETTFPQLDLDPAPDTRTGLRKVSFGMTDVLVSDLSAASHYLEQEGITNLHIVGESGFIYHMGFAVRSDWPELVSILDKALAQINPEQRQEIYDRWIRLSPEPGIDRRRFWATVLGGLAVAVLLLAGTFAWNRSLQRRVRQKTRQLSAELVERQKTTEALRTNEERTRLIIDTALDGVVTMSIEGIITGWSRQAVSDFGWSPEEAIGRPLAELIVPAEHRAAHCAGLARFRETGEGPVLNRRIEISALHRDGHEFPIELSIAPIRKGDTYEFSAFIRDITERKRIEAELTQHREHLEEKVAARTAAFRKAKERADVANRAKSDFLANMSHEIRTPMTAILGYAKILRELGDLEHAPPERIEALDTICRNGDHLVSIINDILDLSKLEAGQMTVDPEPCSPIEIARDVIELLAVRAEEKKLALELRPVGSLPEVILTDPQRLRQILLNLVGNAIKFTETGSVIVTMRLLASSGDDARPRMEFAVTDTGIGMSESEREAVFRPFTQADSSTSRRFGGTGLGLSISMHLANLLGGHIDLRSRPGAGSTFTVTVETGPLDAIAMVDQVEKVAVTSAALPRVRPVSEADPLRVLHGCRVLLAEDTPDNQRLISYHLQKAGIEVQIAPNGRAAIEAADAAWREGRRFDAILMDIQMPEMDGYTASRLLRERDDDVPIIALTASTMRGDRERCLAAGMVDHVAKPIDPLELLSSLVRAIRTSPNPGGSRALPSIDHTLDMDAVRARFDSAGLLAEMVDVFMHESERTMAAIHAAAATDDRAELGRHAHRLRGSAGNFAASSVTDAAERLERLTKGSDRSSMTLAVDELDRNLTDLRTALAKLKQSL